MFQLFFQYGRIFQYIERIRKKAVKKLLLTKAESETGNAVSVFRKSSDGFTKRKLQNSVTELADNRDLYNRLFKNGLAQSEQLIHNTAIAEDLAYECKIAKEMVVLKGKLTWLRLRAMRQLLTRAEVESDTGAKFSKKRMSLTGEL